MNPNRPNEDETGALWKKVRNSGMSRRQFIIVCAGAGTVAVLAACKSKITPAPAPTVAPAPTPTPAPAIVPAPTPAPNVTTTPGTISLTAQGASFDKSIITVTAGANVTINFNNKDNGVSHNFALYSNSSALTSIFVGQIITGLETTTYRFMAPATAGTYFFRSDTYPTTMTGSFIVIAPAASAQAANEIWIRDKQFDPADITVPVGTKVTWINKGNNLHTVSGIFKGTLFFGDSFSHTFTEKGTFFYYCEYYDDMAGSVTVV